MSDEATATSVVAIHSEPGDGGLMFAKQDVLKSRTQSFQSVLSTALLKSLKQAAAAPRNSSVASAAPGIRSNHSFIQAPVMTSTGDDVAIGQQLPFEGSGNGSGGGDDDGSGGGSCDDGSGDELPWQQRNLTLNALKKLNLSPIPIHDDEAPSARGLLALTRKTLAARFPSLECISEPYKPAEVDLSTFASLTRQPKAAAPTEPTGPVSAAAPAAAPAAAAPAAPAAPAATTSAQSPSPSRATPLATPLALPLAPTRAAGPPVRPDDTRRLVASQLAQSAYHRELQEDHHLRSLHPKVPAAVTPPHNMIRRAPSAQGALPDAAPPSRRLQQIKGFRSPMYVPAVLRLSLSHDDGWPGAVPPAPAPAPESPAAAAEPEEPVLSRALTLLAESVESGRALGALGAAVPRREGLARLPPTRRHWIKDENATRCGIRLCPKTFSFFERKHHCRKCGGIFCKEHTSHYLYINRLAQFTTGGRGTLSKVCDYCIADYNQFIKNEFGVDASAAPRAAPRPERAARAIDTRGVREPREQLVGSVPANWSWSSF